MVLRWYNDNGMTQKQFGIGVLILMVVGLVAAGINQLQANPSQSTLTPSPVPTQNAMQYNENSQPAAGQQQTQPTMNPKKTYSKFPGVLAPEELKSKKAVIETAKGNIEFEIYPE